MTEAEDFNTSFSEVIDRLSRNDQDKEYEFWKAPGIFESIKSGDLPLGIILTSEERAEMEELIAGVISLLVTRHYGDRLADHQLNIIHKFMFPKKYEVSKNVIRQLSKKYQSGHLTRGWALRRLMYQLSELVEPIMLDTKNIEQSRVRLLPNADTKHPLYPLVERHLLRGTRLQTLAIKIYLEKVSRTKGGGTIDERTLKRDLQRVRRWEETDTSHMHQKKEFAATKTKVAWKAQIPIRKYSESWVPVVQDEAEEKEDMVIKKPRSKKRTSKK